MKQINEDTRRQWRKAPRRLLAVAVAAAMPFSMASSAHAAETSNGVDISSLASVSASYNTSWNKLSAVNDGELSNDNAGMWGTFGHQSANETLTYTFSGGAQTVSQMRVHLWKDGSGVFLPKSINVTAGDGTAVSGLHVSNITDTDYVTITFDPVTASKFDLVLEKQDANSKGVAVNEWQVFADPTADMLNQLIVKGQSMVDSSSRTISGMRVRLHKDNDAVHLPKSLRVSTGDLSLYGAGSTDIRNVTVSPITDSDWVTLTFSQPVTATTFNLLIDKIANDSSGVAASEVEILDQNGKNLASSAKLYVSDCTYWNSIETLRDGKETGTSSDGAVDQSTLWGTAGYSSNLETVTYSFSQYTIPTMDALTSALNTAQNAVNGDANTIRNAYASLKSAEDSMVKRARLKWYWSGTNGSSAQRLKIGDSMNYVTNLWSMRTGVTGNVGAQYKSGVPTAQGAPSSDDGKGSIDFGTQMNRRTALHEMSHVMGMYVYGWQWKNVLCTGSWHGEKANAVAGQTLSCDNSHGSVWPWGMNYDNEYSVANGKKQVDVQYALRQDTMNPKPIITSSANLSAGTQWADYSKTLSTAPGFIVNSGNSTVSKFEIVNGRLPEGMSLDKSKGVISGKPTEAGDFSFEVRVTNKAGKASNKIMNLTVRAAENPEVPQNLAYYVDAGVRGTATSPQYEKISEAYAKEGKSLLNDKPDQQNNGKWGVSTAAKVYAASGTGVDDTALTATGKSIGYRFTLDPGTYTLQAGFNGFGKNSTMSQKVSWAGATTAATGQNISIADGKTATGTVTFTLTEQKTVTYTATRTAGSNPNLTWISVQRQ